MVACKWQIFFNKCAVSILYILLFQKAIWVIIIEFFIEEFICDHSLCVLIFIDEYVL